MVRTVRILLLFIIALPSNHRIWSNRIEWEIVDVFVHGLIYIIIIDHSIVEKKTDHRDENKLLLLRDVNYTRANCCLHKIDAGINCRYFTPKGDSRRVCVVLLRIFSSSSSFSFLLYSGANCNAIYSVACVHTFGRFKKKRRSVKMLVCCTSVTHSYMQTGNYRVFFLFFEIFYFTLCSIQKFLFSDTIDWWKIEKKNFKKNIEFTLLHTE